MDESTIEALLIVLAALTCGISGYLIAFKGRRNLITGFNESHYANARAFGKSIGISLILFALCLILIAYSWYSSLLVKREMSIWVLSLVFCLLLNYLYSFLKYRKNNVC